MFIGGTKDIFKNVEMQIIYLVKIRSHYEQIKKLVRHWYIESKDYLDLLLWCVHQLILSLFYWENYWWSSQKWEIQIGWIARQHSTSLRSINHTKIKFCVKARRVNRSQL